MAKIIHPKMDHYKPSHLSLHCLHRDLIWLKGLTHLCLASPLTLVMLNKDATPTSKFQPIRLLDPSCSYEFKYITTYSADPDQLASSEAN